jgi:hypothetical protein
VLTLVDRMLQVILLNNVAALASSTGAVTLDQVFFEPPDGTLFGGVARRLSVYLADVRENVKLRSNERTERSVAGTIVSRKMPYRLDCHYLISSYTPSSGGQVPLHHDLLYQVTAALIRSQPLVPAKILAGDPELLNWSEPYRDTELPMTINPPEGFPKLAEYWGTMAGSHPWRPVVHAIITIPVEHVESGPIGTVHHTITIYRPGAETSDDRADIGGTVLDAAGHPVGRAQVFALDAQGVVARTTCDDDGRFIVALPPQVTQIYAAAFGLGTTPQVLVADFVEPGRYVLQFP